MAQFVQDNSDRRKAPRFTCGGRVLIRCLPSDGAMVPGRLRNLGPGGLRVDTSLPIDPGERTEVLVYANAVSFRAVGMVRAVIPGAGARMEFVQMSSGSKQLLNELLTQLARTQATMHKLRSGRLDQKEELLEDLEGFEPRVYIASTPLSQAAGLLEGNQTAKEAQPESRVLGEEEPLLIQIDLFA
jgi:PilZ domain